MNIQEIKNIFGRNVKHFRFHRQLSQVALAEKADISVTFLSNIERGKMFPKVETLSKLTESLNVDVFELFRTDHALSDTPDPPRNLVEEISQKVTTAMTDLFKQYLGPR